MPGAALALLAAGVAAALLMSAAALALALRAHRRPPRPQPSRDAAAAPAPGRALQHVGVVRFNPYHDTGGDYSFAVALLDRSGSGVVLSGLYHRDRCRVYAKPLRAWDSRYTLTDEEREAIEQAREDGAPPRLL